MFKPLEEIKNFTRRFVVFANEDHYDVMALWILHTWAQDAAYSTPYIYINSAEPQSGKTRTMEVAMTLARNAQNTSNLTTAALFRRMADSEPTLFIDEVDTIFSGATNEDLRGVLNSGYKRSGSVSRFVGGDVTDFPTFCPKMLVGIDNGAMPDTLKDRCIPMILKRKKTDEQVERFIPRKVEQDAEALKGRVAEWAQTHYDKIMDAPDPAYVEGISDRKFEIIEPLLVLALIAGGKKYSDRMRAAFVKLLAGAAPAQSLGIRALTVAREMFEEGNLNRLAVADLANKLEVTPNVLGPALSKLDVKSVAVKFAGGRTAKGYHKHAFTDAWERYL